MVDGRVAKSCVAQFILQSCATQIVFIISPQSERCELQGASYFYDGVSAVVQSNALGAHTKSGYLVLSIAELGNFSLNQFHSHFLPNDNFCNF